jgi:hypothetical protein
MFDLSQDSGWSTFREVSGGRVTPSAVAVRLPATVDVREIAVDPSNGRGRGQPRYR